MKKIVLILSVLFLCCFSSCTKEVREYPNSLDETYWIFDVGNAEKDSIRGDIYYQGDTRYLWDIREILIFRDGKVEHSSYPYPIDKETGEKIHLVICDVTPDIYTYCYDSRKGNGFFTGFKYAAKDTVYFSVIDGKMITPLTLHGEEFTLVQKLL